jgi:hypothetical protein
VGAQVADDEFDGAGDDIRDALEGQYEMQTFDFNEGGYIIPAFIDALDAYSTKITGYSASAVGLPLSTFDFENWWFA